VSCGNQRKQVTPPENRPCPSKFRLRLSPLPWTERDGTLIRLDGVARSVGRSMMGAVTYTSSCLWSDARRVITGCCGQPSLFPPSG
jgi:hypothetical protein